MSEFKNRIDLQRTVIKIVNQGGYKAPLTGLAKNAINRWQTDNSVAIESNISQLLFLISSKLFFLANKSQEQISEAYKKLSNDVSLLVGELKKEINK